LHALVQLSIGGMFCNLVHLYLLLALVQLLLLAQMLLLLLLVLQLLLFDLPVYRKRFKKSLIMQLCLEQ